MSSTIQRAVLILLLSVSVADPIIAVEIQSAESTHSPASTTAIVAVVEPPAIPNQQIKLLEEQLRLTREFQTSLLDTVYWALGGVFLVVGLLLGFG